MVIFQLLSLPFHFISAARCANTFTTMEVGRGGRGGGCLGRLASHRPCKLHRRGETAMKADEPEKSEVGGCGGRGGELLAAAAGAGC